MSSGVSLVTPKAQLLRFHDDVAPAGQIADQHAPPVAHQRRVDVLETARHLLHRVDVHAAFVGERRLAHPRLPRVVAQVGDLIHELRELPQLRQRLLRHAALLHLERHVGDHAGEVAVAGAFAVAVDRALDVRRAGLDRRQRVRHPQADVVVRVDAQARRQFPAAAAVMAATSRGREPPFVSHSTTKSAPAFSAACQVARAYSGSSL